MMENPILCEVQDCKRLRASYKPIKFKSMFTQAKLILQSYKPLQLEKGMWFLGMQQKQVVVYEMNYVPYNMEEYVSLNGYPVEPYLYLEGNPNVPDETSLMAEPEQIGWFDEDEESDEMHDITLKEINNILENGGYCEIEVEEEHLDDDEASDYIRIVPVLLQGKVTIRYEDPYDDEGRFDDEEGDFDEEYIDEDDDDEDSDWNHHAHYNY